MRKILLFVTAVLLALPAFSQEIVVGKTDGSSQAIDLDNLKKITFSAGYMVANHSDGTAATKYLLSDITRLLFTGSTEVKQVEMMDGRISYQPETGTACVMDSRGSVMSVYNISGKLVKQVQIESQSDTVDLSDLAGGIYLLRLGNKTIKIVR